MDGAEAKDDAQARQHADAPVAAFAEIAPTAAVAEHERDAFGEPGHAVVAELSADDEVAVAR